MAHSWVEAFDSEEESFEKYHAVFPENTVVLVDTYDTLGCVRKVVEDAFDVKNLKACVWTAAI